VSVLAFFNFLFAHNISAAFDIVAAAFGFVAQLIITAVLVIFALSFRTHIVQTAEKLSVFWIFFAIFMRCALDFVTFPVFADF